MKKIIYLTGGIGTGKSTVAKMFEEFGVEVIDADKIVHEILETDQYVKDKVISIFGKDILQSGRIDRRKLGSIVFEDREKLQILENIVHPKVLEIMAKKISESQSEMVLIEIPLLFEKKMDLHPSVLVYCPKEFQMKRVKERDNLPDKEIENRLNSQIDIEEKKKLADYVIDNSGSLEETKKQVQDLLKVLQN